MKAKRITLILLSVVMILSTLVVVPVSADEAAPVSATVGYQGFTGEEQQGTSDWTNWQSDDFFSNVKNFYIASSADIDAFADAVAAGKDFAKKNVYLLADVTLSKPIGKKSSSATAAFAGVFDGQGYTVTLDFTDVSTYFGVGMFSVTKASAAAPATIKNLVIDGSVTQTLASSGKGGTAAVVGYVENYTMIDNVLNKANVTAIDTTTNEYAGGFVGNITLGNTTDKQQGVSISNSTNKGNVAGRRAGGFYGFGGANAYNCLNEGNVTAYQQNAGGITGCHRTVTATIENCVNKGTIYARDTGYAAGIVTAFDGGTQGATLDVLNCVNYGAVSSAKGVGGIVAGLNQKASGAGYIVNVTGCDNYATITGDGFTAGILAADTNTNNASYKYEITLTDCTQYGSVVNSAGDTVDAPITNGTKVVQNNCKVSVPAPPMTALSAVLADPSLYEGVAFSISSADDLKALSTLVNVNNLTFADKTVYLTTDLDMSGVTDYVPAGRWANDGETAAYNTAGNFAFMGAFDGQNFTISNFDVTVTLEEDAAKFGNYYTENALAGLLFGRMEGGSISNLNVVNSSVTHIAKVNRSLSYVATGGLIGAGNGKTKTALTNLNLDIDVTGFFNLGGVVGSTFYGTIENVVRDGLVKNTNGKAAGGFVCYPGYAVLTNCVNLGDVETSSTEDKQLPAMFVSRSQVNSKSVSLTRCVNYGEFVDAAGAIFATGSGKNDNDSAFITDCVNKSISLVNVPLIADPYGASLDSDTARVINCSNDTSYVADMLKVSYQTKAGTEKGTAVRIITTVDSLNYEKLIYTITANGKTVTISETGVYSSILADGEEITDVAKYGIEGSDYFATFTLDNITGVESFTVQVSIVAADGTVYDGGAYTVGLN